MAELTGCRNFRTSPFPACETVVPKFNLTIPHNYSVEEAKSRLEPIY